QLAMDRVQRAIAIREKLLGAEHSETANSLNTLAVLHNIQGNYATAEPLHSRALKIREKTLGPDHPDTAQSLNNLASVYRKLGNDAAAEPLYLRALKIREKQHGPNHPKTAITINSLAILYQKQRNFSAAIPLYERALKINEETLGTDHPTTAITLNNLAALYQDQKNYAAALPLYERALAIREKKLGADHPDIAQGLNNIALLHKDLGNNDAAEPLYRRSLAIREQTLGENHPGTATALNNIAALLEAAGKAADASHFMDRARRAIRHHVVRVLPFLSEQEQSLFLNANYARDLHMALSLGLANSQVPALTDFSASWMINAKGVTQEALAQRNLLSRDISDPKLKPIVEQLLQVRTELGKLAMSAAGAKNAAARQQQIAKLTVEEQQLSRQLSSSVAGTASALTDWMELTQVKKELAGNAVLIDIARFQIFDFTATGEADVWQPAHYAAWITRGPAANHSTLIDLGNAKEIDTLVETVRRSLQNAGEQIRTDGEETAAAAIQKDLHALADRIWQPLTAELQDVSEIILSPDGALWLAPWNALPIANETDELLIEKYTLRLTVSGRDLVTKPGKYAAQSPVILANPHFNQPSDEKRSAIEAIFKELLPSPDTTRSFSAKSQLGTVSPLPNTGVEAISIQPHLEKYAGQSAKLYQERYALERVAKALQRPRVATFATHGFFLPTQETEIAERDPFATNETRSAALDTSGNPIENPLLRCGLLLSGCNNRDSVVGDDDGILTGLEIVGIDFRGTELVVLSACETGIGEVKNGEGVAGLRQAFQLAGAQSVVASLWQVPDSDSAVIMSDFFANLASGQSRAEALRNAQLKRIETRRARFGAAHPFYWAAWTLTGR
ncbi:MAG: CHAT domain-containing protein, partial [Planctomycetaceae bacterium]|nr:CHAT domain-containing protein [Planctomycetaceae bacterium]